MNWLLWRIGFWKGRAPWLVLPEASRGFVWTLFLGTLAFTFTALVSSLLAAWLSDYSLSTKEALDPFKHLITKRSIQWLVLGTGVLYAYHRGWRLRRAGLPLLIYLALYVAYAFYQRYTGTNWVHGFDAILPPNRSAYGVFRVSGFMGHPISLSYNLMMLILVVYAQLRIHGDDLTRNERNTWLGVAGLSVVLLILSGSRWPLVAIGASLLIAERKNLLQQAKWLALGGGVCAVALWLEGTLLSRVGELFQGDVALHERMPRLLFWKTHWTMFMDHPWYGVGIAAASDAAKDYYAKTGFGDFRELYSAHNIFLQTLADGGLLSFAGLVALLGAFWLGMRRLERAGLRHGLGLLLSATLAAGLMQNVLRDSTYLYALWLCVALLNAEALTSRSRS